MTRSSWPTAARSPTHRTPTTSTSTPKPSASWAPAVSSASPPNPPSRRPRPRSRSCACAGAGLRPRRVKVSNKEFLQRTKKNQDIDSRATGTPVRETRRRLMSMVQKWLSCPFLAVLGTALMLPVSAHAAPSISAVLPDHASMQSFITLYGSDFGDAQGTSYVTLGGRMLPVLVWTPNALHVVVNPLAYNQAPVALNTVYPIQVVTSTGSSKSNTVNFTLTAGAAPVVTTPVASDQPSDQPTFECVNKTLFCPGDILTIFGSGFGLAQGIGSVTITAPSGTPIGLPVLSWS